MIKYLLMNNKELWQTILGELELQVSSANFVTWFKDTSIEEQDKKEILISVPNGFTKEWLENKYHKLILRVIQKFYPDIREIKYAIGRPRTFIAEEKKTEITQDTLASNIPNISLNHRYTFDNFIVGHFNEIAYAASLAVCKNLGKSYNPLFIYGGVGLGKTHLLQAIGNELARQGPKKRVSYVPSERFTNELVDAIQHKQTKNFKEIYRQTDILLIDDIQFISGKETTQEEFFHTFNALYNDNKQIVISSDRPPKAIRTLEERLRSRFEGGMIADISTPDFETRLAIIRKKTGERKINLDNKILEYIAANVQDNIRELEGALNCILAYSQIHNSLPKLNEAIKMLSSIVSKPRSKIITTKQITKKVAEFYDIHIKDLSKRSRQRDIVKPRQIAMYLMRSELNTSYPSIGQELGQRDHTTAIHAYKKIKKEMLKNESLEQEINLIKEKLYTN
ncbi:MAG: chromosomal replication initiator protein DnaA [bacterium]